MRFKFNLLVILVMGLIALMSVPGQAEVKPASVDMPEGVYAEIVPRVELLAGVLSQTTWIDKRGPKGQGNKYFQELEEFFADYKNHRAVKIAQKLTNRGFTYDAPPNFILSSGPLPQLKAPENGYSDYLVGRAGSEKILEEFRIALQDLAEESNFTSFFNQQRSEFNSYLTATTSDFRAVKVIDWLREFFGWSGDEFHLVLAPAMFPGGGYGATINKADGRRLIYQVIRERGRSNEQPEFPAGQQLEGLTLHEWGHSFVNPSLEKYSDLIRKKNLAEFYQPVEEQMKKQAYGSVGTFFNEQVLRATTILAVEDLYGEKLAKKIITKEQKRGFYLTEFTVKQLRYYRRHRDEFTNFQKFVPYLAKQYDQNRAELLPESKAEIRGYSFSLKDNSSKLFTMEQFNENYLSLYRMLTRKLQGTTSETTRLLVENLLALITQPLTHEEGHRSVLTHKNIGSISEPYFNSAGMAYVKGVEDETLKDLRDSDLPNYIRLHTGGLESDYALVLREASLVAFEEENYELLATEYMSRRINLAAYYTLSLTPLYQLEMTEEDDELERDIVGHDVFGAIRHLYRPEMEFYRYTEYDDLTDEEQEFMERVGYRGLLNLVDSTLFVQDNITITPNLEGAFSLGYSMCPFGDFIDENFWLLVDDKYKFKFYLRQFQNESDWFLGGGAALKDYPVTNKLKLSTAVDIWNQPQDLAFRTSEEEFGGAVDLDFKYLMWEDISLNLGLGAKTEGFLLEDMSLEENQYLNLGTTLYF